MTIFDEEQYVELPFMQQLKQLGREIITGDRDDPKETFRNSFRETLLEPIFKKSIKNINQWLEDDQLTEVFYQIRNIKANNLLEANVEATNLLLTGVTIDENRATGEKNPTVKLIDFITPESNRFLAINQFKLNIIGTPNHIIPDIVLFVNGIPVGVVEAKSPKIAEPMEEAINQLLRYSNCRGNEEKEGNERLFYYNQLMIATHRQEARVASINANSEHYLEWKDPYPSALSDIKLANDSDTPTSQHILIEGMLKKQNLLDLIQNFIIFQDNDIGKKVKIVCRYQQFRAVNKVISKLEDPKLLPEDKGGIIWHTQGSGKSLTMVFLIRKLRNTEFGRKFKIVFLTDRKDLQRQIGDTARAIGETVYPNKESSNTIKNILEEIKTDNSNIVNAMIHKFQDPEHKHEVFPKLNTSNNILLLIDEGHRSHAGELGVNLAKALPNAIKIAFTGTPIITGKNRKKSHEVFGEYIDTYTIDKAVEDGATVQIFYEGRTSKDAIQNKEDMDREFEDMFKDNTDEEKKAIMKKYGIKTNYLEAPEIIARKAQDMVKYYLEKIFVNGFKAQVVTVSRKAAITYKQKLDEAIKEEIRKLENGTSDLDTKDILDIALLKQLETAVIVSSDHNDPTEYKQYTDESKQKINVENFKKPFVNQDSNKRSGLGIIIVKDMLLTGFDAPIDQVMFLDRKLIEHTLLQAIARVNRTASGKNCGYVVDYYGIGNHLKEALEIFSPDDIQGALIDLSNEIPKLDERYNKAIQIFQEKGIEGFDTNEDIDLCVDLLKDEEMRAKFTVAYKYLSKSIDIVSPNKAAAPYLKVYKILAFILQTAKNRYRDNGLNILGAGQKVKTLIDKYLMSQGIDSSIPPVSILDKNFDNVVNKQQSNKSKASEMEHAIRYHITQNFDDDPVYYKTLSEKLEDILKKNKENRDLLVQELKSFTAKVKEGRQEDMDGVGLDLKIEMPYYDILKEEIFPAKDLSSEEKVKLAEMTLEIVELIQREITIIDFWNKPIAQNKLQSRISDILMSSRLLSSMSKLDEVERRLFDLTRRLDKKIIK